MPRDIRHDRISSLAEVLRSRQMASGGWACFGSGQESIEATCLPPSRSHPERRRTVAQPSSSSGNPSSRTADGRRFLAIQKVAGRLHPPSARLTRRETSLLHAKMLLVGSVLNEALRDTGFGDG